MAGAFAFIGCMTTIEYEEIAQRMRPRLVKLGGTFFRDDEQAADAPDILDGTLQLQLGVEHTFDYLDVTHLQILIILKSRSSEYQHTCMIGRVVTRFNFC